MEKKLVLVAFASVAEVEYKFVDVEFVAKELVVVALVNCESFAERFVM